MDKMYWNEAAETMPREELRKLQWTKLQKQMDYIYANSSYFKNKFDEIGATPQDIRSIEEFRQLPIFMDKIKDRQSQEISREKLGHPFGEYLCTSPKNVRAIHSTSGTTGLPVIEAFSKKDIAVQNEVAARGFWRTGLRPGDYVLHVTGLSMWLAGMVPMRNYEHMGLAGIPVGAESGVARVIEFAKLIKAKAMFCIPSFAEYIIRKAPEVAGVTARELGIETIIAVGEPGAGIPATRKKLMDSFGAKVFDKTGGIWGFVAVSCDCPDYHGMHLVCEDYHFLDIVDPDTKKPVDLSGGRGMGEMVHTALEWEACPSFRYGMGDMIELITEPCSCGLPGMRMKYKGRVDDLLIVKGVNVFPAAIKGVVDSFRPKVSGEMRIVLTSKPPKVTPPMQMKVEYSPEMTPEQADELAKTMEAEISAKLRVRPKIEMVPTNSLKRDPAKKVNYFEKKY